MGFYWSSAKEICRDCQKVLLFSANNSPFCGHSEYTCTAGGEQSNGPKAKILSLTYIVF